MKVDMSPQAIENRLRLVGELTRACLLLRQNSLRKTGEKRETFENRPRPNLKDKIQVS